MKENIPKEEPGGSLIHHDLRHNIALKINDANNHNPLQNDLQEGT